MGNKNIDCTAELMVGIGWVIIGIGWGRGGYSVR